MAEINHADEFKKPGISAHSINQMSKTPAHFWKTSSYNPDREKSPATDAMLFGRLYHCVVLTPEKVDEEFYQSLAKPKDAICTVDDAKACLDKHFVTYKKSGKRDEIFAELRHNVPGAPVWDDMLEAHNKLAAGRDVLSPEDFKKALDMRDALFTNEVVKKLLGNGSAEDAFTWYREEGGPMCKIRVDYDRTGLVIDLKSSADLDGEALSRTISKFGYHRQMAWAAEAFQYKRGHAPRGAILIFQDSVSMPDVVRTVALPVRALMQGVAEADIAYKKIKTHLKTQDWRAYEEKLEEIDLPAWYYSQKGLV